MRVLLTGSAGFVGRHLLAELRNRSDNIGTFDIKDSGLDVRQALPSLGQVDLAIHCAAVVGGRAKIDGAPLEVAYDFGLDSDFVQYCARTRPGRVVLFSSSAAYPVSFQARDRKPIALGEYLIDLGLPVQPDGVYGLCKIALEYQARELAKLGIPVHVFRPFSGYGSDQDDDYPWPAIMKRALNHEDFSKPFELWSDPAQTRDWIHIDDVVRQVFTCIDQDVRGPINLCTGVPTAFEWLPKLAFQFSDCIGYPRIVQKPGMPSGVYYRVGDPTAINKICPAQITVEQGVRRSMQELTDPYGLSGIPASNIGYARAPEDRSRRPLVYPEFNPEDPRMPDDSMGGGLISDRLYQDLLRAAHPQPSSGFGVRMGQRTFLAPSCDRDQLCTQGLNHPGLCTRPYESFVHHETLD